MLSALDVAKFFVFNAKENQDTSMSNLKLNKMLYFAQGIFLAKYGKRLFEENVEAWEYGPVVYDVYERYSVYGNGVVEYTEEGFDYSKFSVEEMDCLMLADARYGCYTPSVLVDITHNQMPWHKNHDGTFRKLIPDADMIVCFRELEEEFDSKENVVHEVGYRDEEGYLVLPKEYDD